jgi:hypothetical protein
VVDGESVSPSRRVMRRFRHQKEEKKKSASFFSSVIFVQEQMVSL